MKVTCLMAQTLDGFIAKDRNHFPDWTEKADKIFFRQRTSQSGVMIMGRTTFETLPGVLPGRLHIIMSRQAGEWDEHESNLVYTSLSPQKILEKLADQGFDNPIIAGGTTINSVFARAGLIDELIVTISPVIFGQGFGVFAEDITLFLELVSHQPLGQNSLIAWYKITNSDKKVD